MEFLPILPSPLCRIKPVPALVRNLLKEPPGSHAMEQPKQAKEKVREYMERRQVERRQNARSPLHEPDQIRHEIGWDMVDRRHQQDRRGK